MASRPLMIAALLGASVGVPYVASHSAVGDKAAATAGAGSASAPGAALPASPLIGSGFFGSATSSGSVAPMAVGVAPLVSHPTIEQVIRFDVTKEWVYQHWARKSTGPTDVGLFSVRVQLVTGTQPSSVAGALTYFFNEQNQVEHISFHGRSGDPTQFAALILRNFQLQPASAAVGEKLYELADGGGVRSELRLRAEPVVNAASPTAGSMIDLELARPGSQRYLPPRGTGLQIPPVASTAIPTGPTEAASSENFGASAKSAVGSYFNNARFATPEEEGQVLWRRWPN